MPALPTFTVTQAQADRLLAAFGSPDAYKAWLKDQLIEYVVQYEAKPDAVAFSEKLKSSRDSLTQALVN